MPVITILGFPSSYDEEPILQEIEADIKCGVSEIKELGLTTEQVSVFFPSELLKRIKHGEIVIFVDGLFVKKERNEAVRRELASVVGNIIKKFIYKFLGPEPFIEVFVRPFDPAWGFWSSAEEETE